MAINVWAAGQDALLDVMAEREMAAMKAREMQRQDRLDEEGRQHRQSQMELQNRQLASLDEDRQERQEAAKAAAELRKQEAEARAAGRAAEAEQAKQLRELAEAFATAKTPEERNAIRARAAAIRGEAFPSEVPAGSRAGFSLSPGQVRYDADGKIIASRPDRPAAGTKEDPGLSSFVRQYLDTLPTKVEDGKAYDFDRARAEVMRHLPKWHEQRNRGERGDNPDAKKILAYLQSIFPVDSVTRERAGVAAPAAGVGSSVAAPDPLGLR